MTCPRVLFASVAAVLWAGSAPAQSPPTVPAPASGAIAKPNCTKPGEVPGRLASDLQRRAWQRDYSAWGECMKKFIDEQRALAEPYNRASNAAIEEYNATVTSYNGQIEKLKEDAK